MLINGSLTFIDWCGRIKNIIREGFDNTKTHYNTNARFHELVWWVTCNNMEGPEASHSYTHQQPTANSQKQQGIMIVD